MQKVQGYSYKSFHWLSAKSFSNYFTLLYGSISPFPHGTCALSEYKFGLSFVGGPTVFKQNLACFVLLLI